MYHFLSGYTAKVAGTERGVTEPQATFSACFGAPFLPLPPRVYAEMLGEKLARHKVHVWLVNTGWTGGPYGVGHRMKLDLHPRHGDAPRSTANSTTCPTGGPRLRAARADHVPGVPQRGARPPATWADPAAYDAQAGKLAEMFRENFLRFESEVTPAVRAAGPR